MDKLISKTIVFIVLKFQDKLTFFNDTVNAKRYQNIIQIFVHLNESTEIFYSW